MNDEVIGVYVKLKIKNIDSGWSEFIKSIVSKVNDLGTLSLYEYYVRENIIDLHERFHNNESWIKHIEYFGTNIAEDFFNHFEIEQFNVYGKVNDQVKELLVDFKPVYYNIIAKI
tara:strand:+ start:147 stop:491 length:345 start_codon:yes stop_codon:yes gene_type:complete